MTSRSLGFLAVSCLVVACTNGPRGTSSEPVPVEPSVRAEPPACTAACEVERIYAGDHPSMLALDHDHAYFVQGSILYRVARRGGQPEALLEGVVGAPVIHGDRVFACRRADTFGVDVVRLTTDGSPPPTIARALGCKLAALGDYLYFPNVHEHQFYLARAPISGGGETEQVLRLDRHLESLVADATHLYFTTVSGSLRRFDPATRGVETLVEGRKGMMELELTDSYALWLENSNLVRISTRDRAVLPERVANFQDVLDFASDGTQLYWASVSDEAWRRLAPDGSMVTYPVPLGASSIVVDGTRVWWAVFADEGGIFTLDTCGCADEVLVPTPAIRGIVGPDEESPIRLGHAYGGTLTVQVNDLSSDEYRALEVLEVADDGSVPPGAEGLPPRFRIGDQFRATTTKGVFDATLVGFESGAGGSGTLFSLQMEAPGIGDGVALVTKPDGPELGPLRPVSPDPADAARYLPAVRKAVSAAGFDGKRITTDQLSVVRGKFPAPHVAIIALEAPSSGADEEDVSAGYLSALLLGDRRGAISGAVYEPNETLDAFAIEYLVDVGADGIDEVGFSSFYYEGSYDHLLEWQAATPRPVTLAGDGA